MPANPLGVALRNRRAGHHTLVWARPDLQAPENFSLTSPAFEHGTPIPEKHRGRLRGPNISPALNWTPPPAARSSSPSSCRTPTSRSGSRPPTRSRSASTPRGTASPRTPSPTPARSRGSGTARAPSGGAAGPGPCRSRSHGPHAYVFQLFALDQAPALPDGFTLDNVIAAIKGHVIGRARLDGTYEIR